MKNRGKLKRYERFEIAILLGNQYSKRAIAQAMTRSPNTICYEINNNSTNGVYDPLKADAKARVRKRMAKFQWKKIDQDKELRNYIISGLKKFWGPDEISGNMKIQKQPFYASKTAIYEWLYSPRGQSYCKYLYSKQYYPKKRKTKKTKRVMIPNRTSIDKRFKGANNRTRYGHWEVDAIVSIRGSKGSLAVSYDRKAKLCRITKCKNMSAQVHAKAHQKVVDACKVISMTFDNGIENKKTPISWCASFLL